MLCHSDSLTRAPSRWFPEGAHRLIESGLRNTLEHQFQRLPRDSRARRANDLLNKFSSKPLTRLPSNKSDIMTKSEFCVFAARYFCVPSSTAKPKLHNPIPGSAAVAHLDPHGDNLTSSVMRGPASFMTAHNTIARGLVRLARACGVRARYEPRDELGHLIPPDRLQEARDARVQGMRPDIVVDLPYFINNEEGWSRSTREEWLEIKTLHYGRMYTRGSFDKAPA